MEFGRAELPGRATFPIDDIINLSEWGEDSRKRQATGAVRDALLAAGMAWVSVVDIVTLPLKGETWAIVSGPGLPVWRRGVEPWHYPSLTMFASAWKVREPK